eukprot:6333669-Prymnesium_polylepis.1
MLSMWLWVSRRPRRHATSRRGKPATTPASARHAVLHRCRQREREHVAAFPRGVGSGDRTASPFSYGLPFLYRSGKP